MRVMNKSAKVRILLISLISHVFADAVRYEGVWTLVDAYQNLLPREVNTSSAFPARSNLHCSMLCQAQTWCTSFFYNDVTGMCALQFVVHISPENAVYAAGWNYFRFTSASCPWKTVGNHTNYVIDRVSMTCYLVVTSPTMSWLSANHTCASRGDMLTVLEPVEKAKFIYKHVNTNDVYQQTRYFSIGARRPENAWNTTKPPTGPDYIWLDGQPVNFTATAPFWVPGRPNNKNRAENVIALRKEESFLWEDGSENMVCGYICERPLFD